MKMNHTTNKLQSHARLFLLFIAVSVTLPAWALTLDGAKKSGLIGETTNGYLAAVVSNPAPEVRALLEEVNQSRKKEYQRLAEKNGTELEVIESLAGEKLQQRAGAGEYIQQAGGRWIKK